MRTVNASYTGLVAIAAFAAISASAPARAERPDGAGQVPAQLEGVGVTEKLGARLPEALEFTDASGKAVRLGDLVRGKPLLLTMNYSDCPMLCTLQLNALLEALNQIDWRIGDEFDVVTVSLDPKESPERAAETKARYLSRYTSAAPSGAPHAAEGWRFLVGPEANVRAVADAVGFGYQYSDERDEYLHQAAFMVISPKGAVSRYLYGVDYSPQTVRLSMVEASEGKQVSTLDALVLYCFYYDANAGSYTPVVRNIMKLGGAVTVVVLAIFVGAGFTVRRKKRSADPAIGV